MEEEVEFDPIDRQLKKLTDHAVDHKSKIVSMNKEMTKEFVSVKKQLKEMDEWDSRKWTSDFKVNLVKWEERLMRWQTF